MPGERLAKKRRRDGGVVRELRRNAPKFSVDSCREGGPTAFRGAGKTLRRSVGKKLVKLKAIAVYLSKLGSQNGNPD